LVCNQSSSVGPVHAGLQVSTHRVTICATWLTHRQTAFDWLYY